MKKNPLAAPDAWNLVAEGYADEAPIVVGGVARRAAELTAPSATDEVIDVACGPGTLSLLLAPKVKRLVAVDFSPDMIARLRRDAEARGIRNVEACVGDGQDLPFEDALFDSAYSLFGLMFFPDRAAGFAELHRVLRPRGLAVVSSWAPIEQSSLVTLMFGALAAADPAVSIPPRNMLSLESREQFLKEFRAAGFDSVIVEPFEQTLEFAGPEPLWTSMARSSAPIALMRKRLAEEAWQQHSERALKYIQGQFSGGPIRLTTTALLGIGKKPRTG